MDTVWYVIALALTGLVVGALGRLVVPGRDPMGLGATMLVGLAGGFAAALLARAIWDEQAAPGLLLSVLMAALFVWLLRGTRRRGFSRI